MTKSSKSTRRRSRAAGDRRNRSTGRHALGSERLESRLALAVYVNVNGASSLVTPGGTTPTTPGSTTVTVYSDGTDDVFLQQVATSGSPTLLVANNSSFLPRSFRLFHG